MPDRALLLLDMFWVIVLSSCAAVSAQARQLRSSVVCIMVTRFPIVSVPHHHDLPADAWNIRHVDQALCRNDTPSAHSRAWPSSASCTYILQRYLHLKWIRPSSTTQHAGSSHSCSSCRTMALTPAMVVTSKSTTSAPGLPLPVSESCSSSRDRSSLSAISP